jgi:segregation and condensation protein B
MNPSEDVKIEEQEQSPQETPAAEVSEPVVEAAPEESQESPAAQAPVVVEEAAAAQAETEPADTAVMNAEELLGAGATDQPSEEAAAQANLKAVVEAAIYITEEPLTVEQVANALDQPKERIAAILAQLIEEYAKADRGITIREVAGGFKMGTKPEHHEAIRNFVKRMKPPLKLSIAALETLAVIAYKQPITAPEIMEIRGVQGAGVIKTLLDRKLIAIGGRKQVVGKPILYKTTKEFLMQFGLKDLSELPTLKEFEELRRLAFADTEEGEAAPVEAPKPAAAQPEAQAEDAPAEAPASQESVQVEQASRESDFVEAAESPAAAADSETTTAASSE